MLNSSPRWARFVMAAALSWHLLALLAPAWVKASKEEHGRDFASYYYAVQVAADGKDPYLKQNLDAAARVDKTRKAVFPYFYPPTFLLPMVWVQSVELVTAYRLWFWLDELFLLALALALWRWWAPLSTVTPVILVVILGMLTAIPNNHLMGQVNIPVLTAVVMGLMIAERPGTASRLTGGSLLGIACMMKMSPGLLVAWCLLHRRYMVVGAACLTGVLLSLFTLPLVNFATQVRFYTEVLPQFGSGDYNGLSVPIGMFGNHSVPNIFHGLSGGGATLSSVAGVLSTSFNLLLIGWMGWKFRRPAADRWQSAAQWSAVCAAMLLVPVYTYEHHMVWLIPSATLCALAVIEGRLSARWSVPVGLAICAWCYDLADLKQLWLAMGGSSSPAGLLVQELKFVALLVLLFGAIRLGSGASQEFGEQEEEAVNGG